MWTSIIFVIMAFGILIFFDIVDPILDKKDQENYEKDCKRWRAYSKVMRLKKEREENFK